MGRSKKPIEGQESMFDQQPEEHVPESAITGLPSTAQARTTDPPTSHAAARSVSSLTKKQLAVHALLRQTGPMTDETLVRAYNEAVKKRIPLNGVLLPEQSPSGIRTRRKELAEADPALVRVKDIVKLKTSGRKAQRWEAIPLGKVMESA